MIVSPTERLSLAARHEAFLPLDTADGGYATPQTPIRGRSGGDRFVGQDVAILTSYRINDAATFSGSTGRFLTGAYLTDNPPDDDVTSMSVTLDV